MADPRVSVMVRRVRITPEQWAVTCAACEDSDFLAQMFDPAWIVAGSHPSAMSLARWHVDLHREQQCRHCHYVPRLPKPQVIDAPNGLFRYAGGTYVLTEFGVRAIEPVSS